MNDWIAFLSLFATIGYLVVISVAEQRLRKNRRKV